MISYLMHSCVWKHTRRKSGGKKVAVGVVPANETTVVVEMMNTQEVLQALKNSQHPLKMATRSLMT